MFQKRVVVFFLFILTTCYLYYTKSDLPVTGPFDLEFEFSPKDRYSLDHKYSWVAAVVVVLASVYIIG